MERACGARRVPSVLKVVVVVVSVCVGEEEGGGGKVLSCCVVSSVQCRIVRVREGVSCCVLSISSLEFSMHLCVHQCVFGVSANFHLATMSNPSQKNVSEMSHFPRFLRLLRRPVHPQPPWIRLPRFPTTPRNRGSNPVMFRLFGVRWLSVSEHAPLCAPGGAHA